MSGNTYETLPEKIKEQIDSLLPETGLPAGPESREKMASIWTEKLRLFESQIKALDMELIGELTAQDNRGAIILTYSGSLVSLGPDGGQGRWFEYASIKVRTDVPSLARGDHAKPDGSIKLHETAGFLDAPVKHTSHVYAIACCLPGTSPENQDARIREATIFLTNGFVKLNRSISLDSSISGSQFDLRSIIGFVAKRNDITAVLAKKVIDDFLQVAETGALLGERVSLGPVGSLILRKKTASKARVMKNPRTGEELLIPAKPESLVPKIRFSKQFKEKALSIDPDTISDDGEDDGED